MFICCPGCESFSIRLLWYVLCYSPLSLSHILQVYLWGKQGFPLKREACPPFASLSSRRNNEAKGKEGATRHEEVNSHESSGTYEFFKLSDIDCFSSVFSRCSVRGVVMSKQHGGRRARADLAYRKILDCLLALRHLIGTTYR